SRNEAVSEELATGNRQTWKAGFEHWSDLSPACTGWQAEPRIRAAKRHRSSGRRWRCYVRPMNAQSPPLLRAVGWATVPPEVTVPPLHLPKTFLNAINHDDCSLRIC